MAGGDDREHAEGAVAVVVPAAGQGRRLGGPRKQFRSLGGRPLLVQTLLVFERHPAIDYLLVAAPAEAVRPLEEALRAEGLTKLAGVAEGGATRQASVRAGLRRVPAEVAYVLVHDAVRPFVHAEEVSRLLRQVRRFGAASLVSPVADTLRRARGGVLAETVPRDSLFRMQTPQGFRCDWLVAAHEAALEKGVEATDDVELVQRLGHPVELVMGGPQNIKITTAEDWAWAVHYWPCWAARLEEA